MKSTNQRFLLASLLLLISFILVGCSSSSDTNDKAAEKPAAPANGQAAPTPSAPGSGSNSKPQVSNEDTSK